MLSAETRKRNTAEIGSTIKARRQALGMTQKDLAAKLDLSYYTMISQIENGYVTLPPAMWVQVADALGLDKVEWVTTCLDRLYPDIFVALFGSSAQSEVTKALRALHE